MLDFTRSSEGDRPDSFSVSISLSEAGASVLLPDHRILHLRPVTNLTKLRKVQKNALKFVLDCDKLYDNFVARSRAPGDRAKLVGRGVTKTLKNLFQERDLTEEERGRCVILADDGGIVYLEGFGVVERVAPDDRSVRMMTIEIEGSGNDGEEHDG